MTLAGMFGAAGVRPRRLRGDAEISRAFIDSRACVPGALFVAMPEGNLDPHSFIESAIQNGAGATIVHDEAAFEAHPDLPMALLDASEYPDAMWRLMDALYDHPSREMTLVGVTGTNGKTTTAWLVRQLFTLLGKKAGYLGTLGFSLDGRETVVLNNTTPYCVETYDLMAQARDAGIEAMAMEVSSHALAERRVDGLEFDVAVFTNLTQDHLDFHRTMEAYAGAKRRLFTELLREGGAMVLNYSEPTAVAFAKDLSVGVAGFAHLPAEDYFDMTATRFKKRFGRSEAELMVYGLSPKVGVDEVSFALAISDNVGELGMARFLVGRAPLGGSFNVDNLLAAITTQVALGANGKAIEEATPKLKPVPGRFEPVPNDLGIGVLVDYAHTPDALEKVLDTAKSLTKGRLIAVFGCGGDRDRTKRPKMARAASERADLTVVTSDNPRTEDAAAILAEVLTGVAPGREAVAIEDRREAVAHAIRVANPGDTVVIAGKGHEDYQILGRTKVPMDDRELAREALMEREASAGAAR